MSNTTQIREGEILPGLNLDKFISHGVDSGMDLSSKEYTAENLLRNHPDKYGIAARLIFAGVSKRFICEVVKISNRTVNAIELRESQTRGAEILQNRIETKRRKLALLLTQHLEDLLSSEETIKKLGVDDLLRLIDRLSPEQSNQKSSSSKRESGQDPIDVEPIEPRDPSVEAYAKIYRLDGLEAEKNPAARVDVSPAVNRVVSPAANPAVSQAASPAADGSSVSQDANQDVDSVRESCNQQDLREFSTGVDNPVDKQGENPTSMEDSLRGTSSHRPEGTVGSSTPMSLPSADDPAKPPSEPKPPNGPPG